MARPCGVVHRIQHAMHAATEHPASYAQPDAADSPLVALADAVFDSTSPYEGDGFRNHCRRLFHFATMLMDAEGVSIPHDLAYLVAMIHDLGIVSEQDQGANYLQRSRALFHRITADVKLPDVDLDIIDECLVYNHRVRAVPNLSKQADCFRRAVQIEHTHGYFRFGLPKRPVRALFDRYPRGNFDRVLVDFTMRTVRREPKTLIDGIFL